MQLDNSFSVSRSPAETWDILMDVPTIAGCVPGAELTSEEPDGSYKGTIGVKLGPVALTFAGVVTFVERDPDAGTATIKARGVDSKGRGNASATSRMSLSPSPDGTLVSITTDLQLAGMVAQYGRASGVIAALADEIISQFAANLRAVIASRGGDASVDAQGPVPTAPKANPIGGGLLWRALVGWLRGLFGRR